MSTDGDDASPQGLLDQAELIMATWLPLKLSLLNREWLWALSLSRNIFQHMPAKAEKSDKQVFAYDRKPQFLSVLITKRIIYIYVINKFYFFFFPIKALSVQFVLFRFVYKFGKQKETCYFKVGLMHIWIFVLICGLCFQVQQTPAGQYGPACWGHSTCSCLQQRLLAENKILGSTAYCTGVVAHA